MVKKQWEGKKIKLFQSCFFNTNERKEGVGFLRKNEENDLSDKNISNISNYIINLIHIIKVKLLAFQ